MKKENRNVNIGLVLAIFGILLAMAGTASAETYKVDVDSYYGFGRVTNLNGSAFTYDNRTLSVNLEDTVIWVNDADPDQVLTIVSKDGLFGDAYLRWNYQQFRYIFYMPGTYDIYIKEYPRLQHQTIVVKAAQEPNWESMAWSYDPNTDTPITPTRTIELTNGHAIPSEISIHLRDTVLIKITDYTLSVPVTFILNGAQTGINIGNRGAVMVTFNKTGTYSFKAIIPPGDPNLLPRTYAEGTIVVSSIPTTTTPPKFRVGPSVTLRPVTDMIEENQDGIVELFMNNPSLNDVMLNVDTQVSVPTGLHVSGENFGEAAGAGVVAGTFSVPQGKSRTISITIKADKSARKGSHTLQFTGLYWPGDNKDDYQPISLTYVVTVERPTVIPIRVVSWGNNLTNDQS